MLELSTLYESNELPVVFTKSVVDLEFFAGHVFVPLDSAFQAVVFVADWAFEASAILRGIEKAVATVGSWAP